MVERFDPPRDVDWKPLPMRPDIAGQYVRYSDLAAARAEIERLTKERDEALAQVAFSQMEMRDKAAKLCEWHSETLVTTIKRLPVSIDTQAALEAYGREKVREGMQRAADLFPVGSRDGEAISSAILADMEKLK